MTATTYALAAESMRISALCRTTMTAMTAAGAELKALLTEDQYRAVQAYVDGPVSEQHNAWTDLVIAEIARHAPGFAPALAVLTMHCMEERGDDHGRCCEPAA